MVRIRIRFAYITIPVTVLLLLINKLRPIRSMTSKARGTDS